MLRPAPRVVRFLSCLLLVGCMTPTPFGEDVDEQQLNEAALRSLGTPRSRRTFRFIALGDSHDAYDELENAVASINRVPDVEFVLHVGDVSEYGLAQEFEWSARALSGLRAPTLVLIGNHDALGNGKAVYRNLFGPFDFSFRYGAHKFILFNSNSLEFAGAAPARAWLEAELSDLQGADSAILVTHQNLQAPDTRQGSNDAAFYEHLLLSYPIRLLVHGHLDEFLLTTWQDVARLQLGTFRSRHQYSIVSLSEDGVDVSLCDGDSCSPQLRREPGSSSDETAP